jgi:hypothetical protein
MHSRNIIIAAAEGFDALDQLSYMPRFDSLLMGCSNSNLRRLHAIIALNGQYFRAISCCSTHAH